MFSLTYNFRYGDYKDFETIKPSAVLDVVQDIATRNSAECGYDMHRLKGMNLAWLLQGINLHFEDNISTSDPIVAHTAIRNMKGVVSDRGTIIEQQGRVVAKTVAAWFLFDGNRMRPIRIPEDMAASYEIHDFADPFFTYKKPELYEAEKIYTVRIGNGHIDTNRHLNNQKSAELLMDALPADFSFNDMKILYKKAAYLGDILSVCLAATEKGYFVKLENAEGELCVAATFENDQKGDFNMNYVNTDNFTSEVLESPKTVLLDFYADWCGPCQMLSPILEEIAAERPDVKICKVNVDTDPALAVQFGINSIPALFVFKNGEVTNQSLGLRAKADILNML